MNKKTKLPYLKWWHRFSPVNRRAKRIAESLVDAFGTDKYLSFETLDTMEIDERSKLDNEILRILYRGF